MATYPSRTRQFILISARNTRNLILGDVPMTAGVDQRPSALEYLYLPTYCFYTLRVTSCNTSHELNMLSVMMMPCR